MPDVDPFLFCLQCHSNCCCSMQTARSVESPKKKVKMSTVIDQQDETEVSTLSRSQVDINFQKHVVTAGAELLQEAAPSPEQIAAMEEKLSPGMRNRMLTSLFSHPFGRRMQRLMKLTWNQSYRCARTTRFRRMVCMFQSLQYRALPAFGSRWNVTQSGHMCCTG